MQKFFFFSIAISFLLSGCAVYKIDIQQGNVVTQEQLNQLSAGMSAQKVRFIMGTPLLVDTFHSKRWDYYYSFKAGHQNREQRLVSLYFDDSGFLNSVGGDVVIQARDPNTTPVPEPSNDRLPIL